MSNDRISLKCAHCRQRVTLFKYTVYDGYCPNDWNTLGDFMREHIQNCHPQGGGADLGRDPGFVLLTEELELELER